MGIPARQVYTPRWAHTDDNHAWVEIWVDGQWHFVGACEPEPELDRGWFASPAKRAMMTRTFVFGKYNGPEEKLNQTRFFTEINLMPNYALPVNSPLRLPIVQVTRSKVQRWNSSFTTMPNFTQYQPAYHAKGHVG